MTTLSVDIETFSSVDLKTSGVYKYADAPDFEIMLIAYAFNDQPVKLIDMTAHEYNYDLLEFNQALREPNIIKTAFNANFERTCLKHLGINIDTDPKMWQCTAVHAASLGLPRSLADVGKAIGLEPDKQKLKSGMALINYFCKPCKPTKANGMRTRNLPEHDRAKWELFKAYCIQDVEAERGIRQKLAAFPVPESEQRIWELDQVINDRGVGVDRVLVQKAIEADRVKKIELIEEITKLTGLDNPNSISQLKGWLEDEEDIEIESLNKATVPELLADTDSDIVRRVLGIRKELGKTSISKYKALDRAMNKDDRIRGTMLFYGARTGRWCLTGDHEVLTPDGWVRLDEWQGGKIICWSSASEMVSFQKSKALEFEYSGEMYEYDSARCAQVSTPDHKMAVLSRKGFWEDDTVQNLAKKRISIPFTGRRTNVTGSDHAELRVLIMTQADGHYTEDGSLRFHFVKQRKIERCKSLLRKSNVFFTEAEYENRQVIIVKPRYMPLWLRTFRHKNFGPWLLDESADVVFEELEHWDGYRCGPNSIQYSSNNKNNIDFLQALAHTSGRSGCIVEKKERNENWNTSYCLNIWLTPGHHHEIRNKPKVIAYSGKVYCAETPTGYFMVRRLGRVWITGNSGRIFQPQNLPQNKMDDLDFARGLLRDGNTDGIEAIYGNLSDTLSQLIRTALVPQGLWSPNEKSKFIVSDFSAIEARVLAWIAGEAWRMDVFKTHGKIYEASASQMFKVPLESISKSGENYSLRQKGKISELALGYGGSVGALKAMGALNMGLTEPELQPLVDAWRNANTAIIDFWWAVGDAAIEALESGFADTHGLVFTHEKGILFIRLPNGRRLAYQNARIEKNKFGRDGVVYDGIDGTRKTWGPVDTYGPKLVENIVQAISRDILAESMIRLKAKGHRIVMHVHDEVIIEAPESTSVEEISAIMAEVDDWAKRLPMRADGYECVFYKKD